MCQCMNFSKLTYLNISVHLLPYTDEETASCNSQYLFHDYNVITIFKLILLYNIQIQNKSPHSFLTIFGYKNNKFEMISGESEQNHSDWECSLSTQQNLGLHLYDQSDLLEKYVGS